MEESEQKKPVLVTALKMIDRTLTLVICFFLLIGMISAQHSSEMQKRQYCYTYISSAGCFCQQDIGMLLNDSVKIFFREENKLSLNLTENYLDDTDIEIVRIK